MHRALFGLLRGSEGLHTQWVQAAALTEVEIIRAGRAELVVQEVAVMAQAGYHQEAAAISHECMLLGEQARSWPRGYVSYRCLSSPVCLLGTGCMCFARACSCSACGIEASLSADHGMAQAQRIAVGQ